MKKLAASAKCTAEPPSMRSRSPNGVLTESNAIEPTTVSDMRPCILSAPVGATPLGRRAVSIAFSAMEVAARAKRLRPRAAGPDFPAIGDYGFLSDCHTGALVAPDGTVEWLCLPRFDSPSVFAALLDRGAGRLPARAARACGPRSARRYVPGTNVLETTWMTDTGWVVVRDALALGPGGRRDATHAHARAPAPRRRACCSSARSSACRARSRSRSVCDRRFDYATEEAPLDAGGPRRPRRRRRGGGEPLRLLATSALEIDGSRRRGTGC